MSDEKYREFWLQFGTPDVICETEQELFELLDDWRWENMPRIHVISYEAYADLKAENADIKNSNNQAIIILNEYKIEIERLKEINQALANELQEYKDICDE